MSRENINRLVELIRSDPDLQRRVGQINRSTLQSTAHELSRLSLELGCPFTAEEFLREHYGLRCVGKAC